MSSRVVSKTYLCCCSDRISTVYITAVVVYRKPHVISPLLAAGLYLFMLAMAPSHYLAVTHTHTVIPFMTDPEVDVPLRVLALYLFIDDTLSVPGPASLGEVVDSSKFNKCREDEGIADSNEPVHSSSIGHLGQWITGTNTQGCHCENCSYTWNIEKSIFNMEEYIIKRQTEEKGLRITFTLNKLFQILTLNQSSWLLQGFF